MDRGTYIAATGGALQLRRLEVQNNNLANIDTVGYKRLFLTSETQRFEDTFAETLGNKAPFARGDHERVLGVQNIRTETDFSLGPIKDTGAPFDVALQHPKDFFVISTPEGPQYTRAGNFTLNAGGQLVTQDGMQVLGDGGPIVIEGVNGRIAPSGAVTVRGQNVGKLQVVRLEDPNVLEHAAGTRFKTRAGAAQPQPSDGTVIPGALEMSNVSAVTGMVDLIVTNRAFEAYTRAAQTIDGMNQAAISQIGKRQ